MCEREGEGRPLAEQLFGFPSGKVQAEPARRRCRDQWLGGIGSLETSAAVDAVATAVGRHTLARATTCSTLDAGDLEHSAAVGRWVIRTTPSLRVGANVEGGGGGGAAAAAAAVAHGASPPSAAVAASVRTGGTCAASAAIPPPPAASPLPASGCGRHRRRPHRIGLHPTRCRHTSPARGANRSAA